MVHMLEHGLFRRGRLAMAGGFYDGRLIGAHPRRAGDVGVAILRLFIRSKEWDRIAIHSDHNRASSSFEDGDMKGKIKTPGFLRFN